MITWTNGEKVFANLSPTFQNLKVQLYKIHKNKRMYEFKDSTGTSYHVEEVYVTWIIPESITLIEPIGRNMILRKGGLVE